MCLTSAEKRRRIISLNLLATLFLMQPSTLLAAFATRAHWCLVFNLCTRTHTILFYPAHSIRYQVKTFIFLNPIAHLYVSLLMVGIMVGLKTIGLLLQIFPMYFYFFFFEFFFEPSLGTLTKFHVCFTSNSYEKIPKFLKYFVISRKKSTRKIKTFFPTYIKLKHFPQGFSANTA